MTVTNSLIQLLTAADETGVAAQWAGGTGTLIVSGTFDSATVDLRWANAQGDTPLALDDSMSLTEAGAVNFTLPPGWLTMAVTSPAGSTSVTAIAKRVPQ